MILDTAVLVGIDRDDNASILLGLQNSAGRFLRGRNTRSPRTRRRQPSDPSAARPPGPVGRRRRPGSNGDDAYGGAQRAMSAGSTVESFSAWLSHMPSAGSCRAADSAAASAPDSDEISSKAS